MILPARCKQFFGETSFGRVHEDFWDGLWWQASQALKRSDEVFICGYSLPEYDERACKMLLRENYSAPIEVCCGGDSESVVERLRSSGRNAHAAEVRYFDSWLNEHLSAG